MSLINDMLRDLQRRETLDQDRVFNGVKPNASLGANRPLGLVVFLVLLGLLLAAAVGWFGFRDQGAAAPLTVTPSPAETSEPSPRSAPAVVPVESETETLSTLTSVTAVAGPSRLSLRLQWRGESEPSVDSDEQEHWLRLRFPNTESLASPPVIESEVLRYLRVAERRDELTMDLGFNQAVNWEASRRRVGDERELHLLVTWTPSESEPVAESKPEPAQAEAPHPSPASAEPSPTVSADAPKVVDQPETSSPSTPMVKSSPRLTPEQESEKLARQAAAASKQGDTARAATLYEKALAIRPDYHEARLAYVEMLSDVGRRGDAGAALLDAVERWPGHAAYRLTLARRLLAGGDSAAAVSLLEAGVGASDRQGEIAGTLAALYQQQGRYEQSVAMYRKALLANDRHGIWWTGLGISLESAGDPAQARAAYREAAGLGLSGDVRSFVESRLEALGG